MPHSAPPTVVVLVHGTFARGAAWTRPADSTLCARLRRALGPAVVFDTFEWSAANRHAARLDAGAALAGHLENLAAMKPPRRIFVIGHSHGATVIAHALRDRPSLAKRLDGIVFLSTPFIQIRRRPHAQALAWPLGLALWLAAMWLSAAAEDQLRVYGWPGWLAGALGLATFALLTLALIGAVYESRPAANGPGQARESLSRIDLAIERLREEFSVRHLDRRRTLIVRANADEAAAALAWVQAISRLLGDLVALLLRGVRTLLPWRAIGLLDREQRPRGWLGRLGNAAGLMLLAYFVAVLVVGVLAWISDALVWLASVFGGDLAGWIAGEFPFGRWLAKHYGSLRDFADQLIDGALRVIMVAGAALLGLAAAATAVFNRAFGRWFVWTALFVEVSVEAAPPGRSTVRQLDPPDQTADWDSDKGAALTHSLSYEDPRAQRFVAAWIRQRLAEGRQTAAD